MAPSSDKEIRRPLKTRDYAWAHKLAHFFVTIGMSPNQMSVASVVMAALGGTAFFFVTDNASLLRFVLLIVAALFIQLRLLANMLDGLMAVEEGKKTATGAIYNEFPDRIADTLFLVGAGYAAGWAELGWLSALLAMLTAYVRALSASFGCGQDFCGPMAKQHRMFVLTVGSVLAAFLPAVPVLAVISAIIALGSAITVARRMLRLARNLSGKPS